MRRIARVAQHAGVALLHRLGLDQRRAARARVLHGVCQVAVVQQVQQADDLRWRHVDLVVAVLPQRGARREPARFGDFEIVVPRLLRRRHAGQEEARVEALAHHRGPTRRDPARPRRQRVGVQQRAALGQQGGKRFAGAQARAGGGAVAGDLVGAQLQIQHARFLGRLARGGDIEGRRLRRAERRLAQARVQLGRRAVQQGQRVGAGIGRVHLAAGKHVGAAQHRRIGVAAQQQHLQPLGAVAQHHHAGRIERWGVDDFVVQFHGAHCERRLGRPAVACVAGRGKTAPQLGYS